MSVIENPTVRHSTEQFPEHVVNLSVYRHPGAQSFIFSIQPGAGEASFNVSDAGTGLAEAQPIFIVHAVIQGLIQRTEFLNDAPSEKQRRLTDETGVIQDKKFQGFDGLV